MRLSLRQALERGRLGLAEALEVAVGVAREAWLAAEDRRLLLRAIQARPPPTRPPPARPPVPTPPLQPRSIFVTWGDAGVQGGASLDPYVYAAPELTGRMGASEGPDERSDLYLTGWCCTRWWRAAALRRLDPIEVIHAHLAKRPVPLRAHDSAVPPPVEAIVERLLAKAPSERYQSAYGLMHDLLHCREELRRTGDGAAGAAGRALYGRGADLQRALAACRHLHATLPPPLVVVRGSPGSGKTYLAREVGRRALADGLASFFVAGKADQARPTRPPAPPRREARARARARGRSTTGALQRLLLAQPAAEAERWRAALLESLGDNARLLVDVAPAAKLLLGSGLPPLPELPPSETQARFKLVFTRLFQGRAGWRPVVVLLDDVQWAEQETLSLAEHLLAGGVPLLLCLTLREGEAGAGHPTGDFLARRACPDDVDLTLAPIGLDECRRLIADAMGTPEGDARIASLASIVLRKTNGNPLHALQFLRVLQERSALRFNFLEGRWVWSDAEVEGLEEGRDMAEIMASSIQALPAATQRALKVSSCCGASFTAPMLAAVLGCPEEEVVATLQPAVHSGLVVRRASHSRAAFPEHLLAAPAPAPAPQPPPLNALEPPPPEAPLAMPPAAHDLIEGAERAELCFRAGLLLLLRSGAGAGAEAGQPEDLFAMANMLNDGLAGDPDAPLPAGADAAALAAVARVNALAAERSRACTAFHRGRAYALDGLRALERRRAAFPGAPEEGEPGPPPSTSRLARRASVGTGVSESVEAIAGAGPRELEFFLQLTLAECEYLEHDYEAAERRLPAVERLALARPHHIRVARLRVAVLSSMNKFRESLEAGVAAMRALWDVHVPLEATLADFERELDAIVAALRAAGAAGGDDFAPSAIADIIAALPACSSPDILDLMQIAGDSALSAGYADAPDLFGLIPARCAIL
eukprot:tig00000615_g2531.t1